MGYLQEKNLDEFSANSQQKCEKAMAEGKFKDEIVPVVVKNRKGDIVVDTDEGPRAGTTAESLAKLRCCSGKPDGVVTAGNASGINDGAAAVVVMSEEKAKELGVTPMATFVGGALGGVAPEIMGVGPVASTRKVMEKTGLTVDDMDLIEANEAFAAQSVAVARDLGFDMSKVNVNGGAIALGHPVGASGCQNPCYITSRNAEEETLRRVLLHFVSVAEWAAQQSLKETNKKYTGLKEFSFKPVCCVLTC